MLSHLPQKRFLRKDDISKSLSIAVRTASAIDDALRRASTFNWIGDVLQAFK